MVREAFALGLTGALSAAVLTVGFLDEAFAGRVCAAALVFAALSRRAALAAAGFFAREVLGVFLRAAAELGVAAAETVSPKAEALTMSAGLVGAGGKGMMWCVPNLSKERAGS